MKTSIHELGISYSYRFRVLLEFDRIRWKDRIEIVFRIIRELELLFVRFSSLFPCDLCSALHPYILLVEEGVILKEI